MAHEVVTSARLLRTKEVAAMLGFDVATIQRKARRGELPCIKFGHNSVRFAVEDVEKYLASKRSAA